MLKTAIFLGAGASAAEGAPLQNDVFKEYFRALADSDGLGHFLDHNPFAPHNAIPRFFGDMFGVSTRGADLDSVVFPSFEEALGILDIADSRSESFGVMHYPDGQLPTRGNTIAMMRMHLIRLLADVVKNSLENKGHGLHKRLLQILNRDDLLTEVHFVTTNYDCIVDDALVSLGACVHTDYGIDFANSDALTTNHNALNLKLYKVHGSLNWSFCSVCNDVNLITSDSRSSTSYEQCSGCRHNFRRPILVPPTFFKNLSNAYLAMVWNKAENSLREVERIIFCGYSFPDADLHVKYLLKRIELLGSLKDVTVMNHFNGKSSDQKKQERLRYERFFKVAVKYTDTSFEDFSRDPSKYL